MQNIYDFFLPIYKKHGMTAICEGLYLHKGTVNRWIEKKEVPPQYYFDLCRIDDIVVDYSQYSAKEKDQFFTNWETAQYCTNQMIDIITELGDDLSQYTFIEPSAGDGAFYNILSPMCAMLGAKGYVGLDIEPRDPDVLRRDFLLWNPTTDKNICVGNPPFGLRGHLALKFINHAAQFSDYVCFILPQLFDSNGKGSCKSRVKGMNLIHSEVIDSGFHYPDGKDVSVNVVFQIWSKYHKKEEEQVDLTNIIKLYSLSDGGTPGSTRNKQHLYSCDFYLPSTCFGADSMIVYDNFENLPHRRGYGILVQSCAGEIESIMRETNWSEVAFASTNGAYNLRFDIIERHIWSNLSGTCKDTNKKPSVMSFM